MSTIAILIAIPVVLCIFGLILTVIRGAFKVYFEPMYIAELTIYAFALMFVAVELLILAVVLVSELIEKLLLC